MSLNTPPLQRGDKVHYVGNDPKVAWDYGKKVLTVTAVNPVTCSSVCTTPDQRLLVGVYCHDLAKIENNNSNPSG